MPKFTMPFLETQRGYYEFEADSLEHAKAIIKLMDKDNEDIDTIADRTYKDGIEEWLDDEIQEVTNA